MMWRKEVRYIERRLIKLDSNYCQKWAFWAAGPALKKSIMNYELLLRAVPILLPRTSRNFPDVKKRNEKKFYNWTSEIIPFIRFGKQMDRT